MVHMSSATTKKNLRTHIEVMRRDAHRERVAAMSEGRRERSVVFMPKKGPGSYRRKPKHPGDRY